MYTILFIAWSPNSPHQSVSRGLLTSSVYLMTHSSDISSPLCYVFQQMYSFPAASWIWAWPEFLYPVPSALIYRAFSQSQRRPRGPELGWLWAQVLLVHMGQGLGGWLQHSMAPLAKLCLSLGPQRSPAEQKAFWNLLLSFSLTYTGAVSSWHLFLESDFALFMNYLI